MNDPTFWDGYFSIPKIQADGADLPLRSVLNLVGGDVADDEAGKRTRIRFSKLSGDAGGVAHVSAAELVADADPYVEPRSKLGHQTTENATPVNVVLFTLGTNERRRIDVVVTATNVDGTKGGTWTIRGQVRRAGAGAVLVSGGTDTAPDAANTALLAATFGVNGNDVRLTITGLAGEDITFGWEARSQKQVFETL